MASLDELWRAAPSPALRRWFAGTGVLRWEVNAAARRWGLDRGLDDADWAALAAAAGADGRIELGRGRWPLWRRAVALADGTLWWLGTEDPAGPSSATLAEMLDLAQEFGRMGLFERDLRTGVGHWDPHVFRIYGIDPAQGTPHWEQGAKFVHPDDRALFAPNHRGVSPATGRHALRFRIVRPDGTVRHLHSLSEVRNGADGRPARMVGVLLDDTETIQRERTQREEGEWRAQGLRLAGVSLWRYDPATERMHYDSSTASLMSMPWSREGTPIAEVRERIHPDDREAIARSMRQALHGERAADVMVRYRRDDAWRTMFTRRMAQHYADGRVIGVLGVSLDVTDLVAERDHALQMQERALQASRAKSEFMARVSHELRTPMNAVLGFTQLLADDAVEPLTPRQRERLEHIDAAAHHLLALIDDVLDLASIEADDKPLAAESVALAAVAQDAVQWVAPTAQLLGVRVEAEVAGLAGYVQGDRRRVGQIAVNLLTNAVKYNRPGGWVRVTSLEHEHDGVRRCGLVVRDSGRGLTLEQRQRVFEAFNRLGAENEGIPGTGIGLTIVRQLAERMGGSVEVDSEPGVGSEFRVWLPAAAPPQPAEAPAAASAEPASAPAAPPLSLLCIEDNEVNMALVAQIVELRPAVALSCAADGAQGIALALRERPDVVLLDLQLPDIPGVEVLRRLRGEPGCAATTFIALSANAMPEDVRAALAAGFDDYWIKPIDVRRFLEGLDRLALRKDQRNVAAASASGSAP